MKEDVLVSIITPSYNQALYLEQTILSVLNQSYSNIEYIIIDGESTDGSVDIIVKHQDKISYWTSEKDKGQADAINKGFAKATGEFICWINSDDLIYPEFISTRVRQFHEHPDVDLIYGDVDQGHEPGNSWLRKGKLSDFNSMLKTLDVPIPQQSAIWRRKVISETGILDTGLHVLLDRDFFIRIARNHNILYYPGSLGFFRVHPDSKSIAESIKWTLELPVYYKSLISKWPEYKKQDRKVMSKCYWICNHVCLDLHDKSMAKKFRKKSLSQHPFIFLKFILFHTLIRLKHFIIGDYVED